MAPNERSDEADSAAPSPACDLRAHAAIAFNVEQAKSLKAQAAKGGLAFDVWLPPQQALWLLGLIEAGKYADPRDAVFNLLGEAQDLAPHEDLRKELLRRSLEAALDNAEAPVPIEDCVLAMRGRRQEPHPDAAHWTDWSGADPEDPSG